MCKQLLKRAKGIAFSEFRKEGLRKMLAGAVILAIGLSVTFAAKWFATMLGDSHYVVTSGAILWGSILLLSGAMKAIFG